jgi:CBS domain-containing protein/uncharacterized protein (DUF2267 family)
MKHDEFIGYVQHLARLASRGDAERATRAVLETLAERVEPHVAEHVAAQLPGEIGHHLRRRTEFRRMSVSDYYFRVSMTEGIEYDEAVDHVRAVMTVILHAASAGVIEKLKAELPEEFDQIFQPMSDADTFRGIDRRTGGHGPRHLRVQEAMTRGVQTVTPDTTIQDAAGKMKYLDVGSIPICEGDRLVGMITDRDIAIRAAAEGLDPHTSLVKALMTPQVHYCYEDEDVRDAARHMEANQIRRLVVLDRQSKLVGILSLGDLALELEGTDDEPLTAEVLERVSEPAGQR